MKKYILFALILVVSISLFTQTMEIKHHDVPDVTSNLSTYKIILVDPNTRYEREITMANFLKGINPVAIENDAIVNGTLTVGEDIIGGNLIAGSGAFSINEFVDTLVLSGITATDIFAITPITTSTDSVLVLGYTAGVDTLFVFRNDTTAVPLQSYSYIRIK